MTSNEFNEHDSHFKLNAMFRVLIWSYQQHVSGYLSEKRTCKPRSLVFSPFVFRFLLLFLFFCIIEAEYAFQLHKDTIPLMMDYRYKPNGWLGFIVGSKFWIDLSDGYKLNTNLDKLIKELGNRGKISVEETIQGTTGLFRKGLQESNRLFC